MHLYSTQKIKFYFLSPCVTGPAKKDESGFELRIILKPTVLDLFRPLPILKRTVNMCLQWFSVTMVYYGLSFAATRKDIFRTH